MQHKFLTLEWKADAEGTIEGYGAFFGNVDLGGDIVMPGAFTRSLSSGRKVKMLRQHEPDDLIGVWDTVTEDSSGLRVKGRILTAVQCGREALELVRAGALDGLSMGYQTVGNQPVTSAGYRQIVEAELWEVSLVTFPMNEMTRIDAVKAVDLTERDFQRLLTRDAGLSRSIAERLMAGGYDAIKAMRDAGDESEDLAALLKARCAL